MSIEQVEVLVPVPILEKFSYLLPSQYKDSPPRPGTRVIVPFGNRNLVGVVWDVKKNITAKGRKLKNIKDVADAGADTFVSGSAIFGEPDYFEIIQKMRDSLKVE